MWKKYATTCTIQVRMRLTPLFHWFQIRYKCEVRSQHNGDMLHLFTDFLIYSLFFFSLKVPGRFCKGMFSISLVLSCIALIAMPSKIVCVNFELKSFSYPCTRKCDSHFSDAKCWSQTFEYFANDLFKSLIAYGNVASAVSLRYTVLS